MGSNSVWKGLSTLMPPLATAPQGDVKLALDREIERLSLEGRQKLLRLEGCTPVNENGWCLFGLQSSTSVPSSTIFILEVTKFPEQTNVGLTTCRIMELMIMVAPHPCLKLSPLDLCSHPHHAGRRSVLVNFDYFIASQKNARTIK